MKKLFPDDLIRKAKFYFYTVFNDGDRVRLWRTSWDYETETVFRSAADLELYIAQWEHDLLEEFDFMAPADLRELGILF